MTTQTSGSVTAAPPVAATTMEQALAGVEADADNCLKGAKLATTALKRLRTAARTGDLKQLQRALADAEQAALALRQQVSNAREAWQWPEDRYLADGSYTRELLETAHQMGLRVDERDERLYCYPMLLRVRPGERAIQVDKALERRLRPSFLVNLLKQRQKQPARFRPEAFLQSLYEAYQVEARAQGLPGKNPVVKLLDIYHLLTLLPGMGKDYSRQEFARDIYLLDQSGVNTTRSGAVVSFPASTGTKSAAHTITVVTQGGEEKRYVGIAFARPAGS